MFDRRVHEWHRQDCRPQLGRPRHIAVRAEPTAGDEQQVVEDAGARGGAEEHDGKRKDLLAREDAADDHRGLALERRAEEHPDRSVLT